MKRIALLALAASLLVVPSAQAAPFGMLLTFQGTTALVSDASGPIGFMFNVDQFTVGGDSFTLVDPSLPPTSIYVFNNGYYEGWGTATYQSVNSGTTFTFAAGENPCYAAGAAYGGAVNPDLSGNPDCLIGTLPSFNTGWVYGSAAPLGMPPAPLSLTYESPTQAAYLDNFAATFGGENPPTDLGLLISFDRAAIVDGLVSISYLTNDATLGGGGSVPTPEPASALLLGVGFIAATIARRRMRQ